MSKDSKKSMIYLYNDKYVYFINYFIERNKFKLYTKRKLTEKIIIDIKTRTDFIYDNNYINNNHSITIYNSNSKIFNLFELLKLRFYVINFDNKTFNSINNGKTSFRFLENIRKEEETKVAE